MNPFKFAFNKDYRRQAIINWAYDDVKGAVSDNRRTRALDAQRIRNLPTEVSIGRFTKINIPQRSDLAGRVFINNYFFDDLDKAYQGETYVKYAVDRYVESVLRNGWSIVSGNAKVVGYLEKRFHEMAIASSTTMEEMFSDFLSTTILYGNAFLIKYRNAKSSSGKPVTRSDGRTIPPIASLFIEDTRKMHIAMTGANRYIYIRTPQNITGRTPNTLNTYAFPFGLNAFSSYTGYPKSHTPPAIISGQIAQAISAGRSGRIGDIRIYRDLDVAHIRYHHVPGEKWAMPPFWPVLPDVDTLRRIEENVELLMYQYGHSLLHAAIGSDQRPGSKADVATITQKMKDMEGNGFIATDHRVNLEFKGAEGKAIRAEEYLKYFKARAFSGLWLSSTTVGEGDSANRATAETVDMIRQDKTIELQRILQKELQPILIELLLEAGVDYGWALQPENIPAIHFPEVDVNKKIALESHILNLYNSNVITETEARVLLGMKPLDEKERSGLFVYAVSSVASLLKLGMEPVAKFAMQRIGGANASTKSIVKPTNQSGQKTGPSQAKN